MTATFHRMPAAAPSPPAVEEETSTSCGCEANVGTLERALSVLAGSALAAYSLAATPSRRVAYAVAGAALLTRGVSGWCGVYHLLGRNSTEAHEYKQLGVGAQQGLRVRKSVTIARSAPELYAIWRKFERLPKIMQHLKHVTRIDDTKSHWIAEGALGGEVAWYAEMINDKPNELIAWQSLPGGDVDTAGSVRFKSLEHGRGTEVSVTLKYDPPGGYWGDRLAHLFGYDLGQRLEDDLRRLKSLLEAGEVPTAR